MVATVRYAYTIYGFPVSLLFLNSIVPIIAVIIVGVLAWVACTHGSSSSITNTKYEQVDKQKLQ